MTLDHEDDKKLLLQIIQNSTVPGAAVMVVAGLVARIQSASVVGATAAQTAADSYHGEVK